MNIAGLTRKGYTAWGAKNTLKGVGKSSMEEWKYGSMEVLRETK